MNLLRLIPGYRRMEARALAAESEGVRRAREYGLAVDRWATIRSLDAQTVENMRTSHKEEVGRLVDLLEKERSDRQWATDRLLEGRDIRPIHEPSPRERIEAEANDKTVPRESLGPRQRATERAQQSRAEVMRGVESQVSEFTARLKAQAAEEARKREEAQNATNGSK